MNGGSVGVRFCFNLNGVAHHKSRVEAKTKVSDYAVRCASIALVLIFLNKVNSTRESDTADVLFKLILAHTDSVVGNGNSALIRVKLYGYLVFFITRLTYS